LTDEPGTARAEEHAAEPVPGLHRLRLDVLLQEMMNRAQDIISVEHQLHRLLDAVIAVASEVTLPDTLRRITELAAELSHAKYAALGVLGPDQTIEEFITVGMDSHDRTRIGEPPSGKGILGLLINDPEPLRLPELGRHPMSFGFPAEHPPMGSFLGVPIRVRDVVFGNLYLTEKREGGEFTERDEDLMIALAAAAGIAIENARLNEETRRRERWLTASAQVTRALLGGAEISETTQLVVEKAVEIVDADAAFLLLKEEDGDGLMVSAAHGEGTQVFVGHHYALVETLAGQVFVDGTPRSYASRAAVMQAISPNAPPHGRLDGPGVLVPLASAGRILGLLSVARFQGSVPFSDADMQMVHTFAGHAALTVEFSRATADRQLLAIYEDRDRIARDLHDLIIQRLFAMGLTAQGLLPKTLQPEVVEKLSGFVDDLDATIHDVRKTIFSLQEPVDQPLGLRGQILRAVSTATSVLGFEPRLTMAGPLDSAVPDGLRSDLLAVVGEALTNVARHSGASQVSITVAVDLQHRTLKTVIEDNGVGPSIDDVPGQGTVNMLTRAQRLGGTSTLLPGDHGGAILTWSTPLGC
jgi:signal transduction histidine kinase